MNNRLFLSNLLAELKISPKYLGYTYLQRIVYMVFENRVYLKSLSKFVYPQIAKEYNTAPKSVEKAIDNALNRAFDKGGLREFSDTVCPSNKEVISYLVNKLTDNDIRLESQVSVLSFK